MHVAVHEGKPWFSRNKVQLEDSQVIYDLLQTSGREGLQRWYRAAGGHGDQHLLAIRLAAAKRCTDEQIVAPLQNLKLPGSNVAIRGNYLERVRLRLAAPNANALPAKDSLGREGLGRQSWHGPHTWIEPYHPPLGWASWQFVWDARLALGTIDAKAISDGRGLENMHLWPDWDVMGDWTTRCLRVEDWMKVPISLNGDSKS
jgi:hypothetical protein